MESLCAATLLDLLLYWAAGRDRGCDLGGLPGRGDSVDLWWRWSRPPTGCVAVWPGYQIRIRVAGSSHSLSAAPTSNAP
jgi:hypothetical protein